MNLPDYYRVLGVSQDAKERDIRQAFYEKAKIFHPDVYKGKDGDAIFKLLNEAYHILQDSDLRRKYDFRLKYGSVIQFSRTAQSEVYERRERMRKEYIRRKMEEERKGIKKNRKFTKVLENAIFWSMAGIISHGFVFSLIDAIVNQKFMILILTIFMALVFLAAYLTMRKKSK